jgi:DNA repair exonuclease SbcCD ATPase subunit
MSGDEAPNNRILRQQEIVNRIKHENEVLKIDLTNEARAKKTSMQGGSKDIERLQDQGKIYVKKIEGERRKIEEIDKEIIKYQELIVEQKKKLGGVNAATINNQLIQKQIKVLENRLDKSLLKFNKTLAQNKELRQKIDEYRRERVIFDSIYKKLERELHEKKKEMAVIIEDSKNAYQARDRAASEMAALQERADKEKAEFESEFKELGDLIREQQTMIDKLRLKQFDRAAEEQSGTIQLSPQHEDSTGAMGTWGTTKDVAVSLSQEKIQDFEAQLDRLRDSTGLTEVDDLVTRFLEAEEQNFSLFNYVNSINSEIER